MDEIRKKIDKFYQNKDYENAHNFMIEQLTKAIQNDEPFIILNLLCELMSYYRVHALFEQGNIMASRAVAIIKMLGQENSLLGATAYLNIATLYRLESLFEQSLEYFKKCHEIYQKQLDETDGRLISLYNNISLLYQETGDMEKAMSYSRKALNLILKKDGVEVEVAITYTNLAQMCFEINDKDEGLDYLNKAIELFEKYGKDDPHYYATIASKAQYYFLNKDYDKSLEIYQLALEKIESTFGKNADYQRVYQNYLFVQKKKKNTGFGMKLARDFYFEFGRKMIEEKFPQIIPYMATGLVGMGSECLGFDDEISRDHDFGAGFCIWLPKEQYEEFGEELQKAYDELPKEFKGFERLESQYSGKRHGVFEVKEFYKMFVPQMPKSENDWFSLDEQSLLMMSSGEVFEDNFGEFTHVRSEIQKYYPENIRIIKLTECIAKMAQSGQYNYQRLQKRGDIVAQNLALNEFINETMTCIYLLNKKYKPYYKWTFHAMQEFRILNQTTQLIPKLLECDNGEKQAIIEKICKDVVKELKRQNLTHIDNLFLQEHIPCLQSKLK